MKVHTSDFKNNIKLFGKQLDSIISYTQNGDTIELGNNDLNSVTPHYEGSILKSVMKELEIDSNVEIPVGTIISYQFGVLVDDDFEYIDFGNYIVDKVEKQEDLNSYRILCYDKMLYSMVDYEELNVTYPITVRDYLNAICQKLGITFASVNDTFANYNRQINQDLYKDLSYTFRDVLDEIAEVTASTICINSNDALEVRYITDTHDTINEEYLKDINVNFGEKYGPVNSIVLSRSAESDNVYIQDAESIAQNGLCEIKIKDNQIMNFNDRSDYLPDLLTKLGGLQYYLNDFLSPGITYYDLCDRYTVQIDETNYSCIMLNDEINITQGLEENIHTDLLETSETDYKKADKTDQRINQTYLIVDKQNQAIEGVISNVTEQDTKINNIQLTVDELNAKIQDIADITISGETSYATFTLDGINESEPIQIKVRPITDNISYDYPHNDYPQQDYSKIRLIRFHNNTTNEDIDYVLPDDLLYYDSTHYDEFYLDYDSHTCQITKRCKWNADGTIGLLSTEQVVPYTYPTITLEDGNYTLSLLGYTNGYLFMRLMAKNIYTSQFYTKVETDSRINATANSITESVNAQFTNYSTTTEMNTSISQKIANNNTAYVDIEVAKKVDNNDYTKASIVAKINDNTSQVQIQAQNIDLQGYITATDLSGSGTSIINGDNITTGNIKSNNYVANSSGTLINLTDGSIDTKNFKVNSTGVITVYDEGGNLNNGNINVASSVSGSYMRTILKSSGFGHFYNINNPDNNNVTISTIFGYPIMQMVKGNYNSIATNEYISLIQSQSGGSDIVTTIRATGIVTPTVTQTSLESAKKNFEKFENALDIINKVDIYKYHLKGQNDDEKKHIGFVIGDKFNYSKEITSENNDGADLYSMISVCFQAIKEQQKTIENLENKIKRLEEK